MPATLIAPPPSSSSPPRPEIELPAISFFGRTLSEYSQFFDFDVVNLRRQAVLDVAAGPSSFVAEACRHGVDAVAVDPRYGSSPDELAATIERDYEHMFTQMRAKRRLFRLRSFASFDEAEADRRLAAQRFLVDYTAHRMHGRYFGAALPRLPFFDGTFDLVLCAHLLFTYAQRYDFAWHLAAAQELARVSAGEVRLHPVCGVDGRPYAELARLRRELRAAGVESEVRKVNYEFFLGASSMLVLRKVATP